MIQIECEGNGMAITSWVHRK